MKSYALAGENNLIYCDFDYASLKGLHITIKGKNNCITIENVPKINGNCALTIIADNSKIHLGSSIVCNKNLFISLLPAGGGKRGDKLFCKIDDGTIFNGSTSIILSESDGNPP